MNNIEGETNSNQQIACCSACMILWVWSALFVSCYACTKPWLYLALFILCLFCIMPCFYPVLSESSSNSLLLYCIFFCLYLALLYLPFMICHSLPSPPLTMGLLYDITLTTVTTHHGPILWYATHHRHHSPWAYFAPALHTPSIKGRTLDSWTLSRSFVFCPRWGTGVEQHGG